MSDIPDSEARERPDDRGLMLRARDGDLGAFESLIRRHQQRLLNFFARMGAYSEAEDMAQETFLRLFRYRARYRPSARFSTFLYVLARHVWADRGRKSLRRDRLTERLRIESDPVGAATGPTPADAMAVREALDRLTPKLREALVLNVYEGLRYREIADVLRIPLGTVKSRISLALDALRGLLDEK